MSADVPAERFARLGLARIVPVLLFASFARPIPLLLIGALTGANGWIVGWVNEKGAGGSILPGWAFHASANLLVGFGAAFNLMG